MADITDGHVLRVYIGSTPVAIAKEKTSAIKFSVEEKDISHKDVSGGWSDIDPGKLSAEISGENLYAEGESFEDLWTSFSGKSKVTVKWSDEVTGNKNFSGEFYITSLEQNATDNEPVSYSYTMKSSGAITRGTNS